MGTVSIYMTKTGYTGYDIGTYPPTRLPTA